MCFFENFFSLSPDYPVKTMIYLLYIYYYIVYILARLSRGKDLYAQLQINAFDYTRYIITTCSNTQVMRIKEVNTKDRMP